MSYYINFKIIIGNPLFYLYLKWAYKKGVDDLKYFGVTAQFKKKNFFCLLCGVGNESTADLFIQFITIRNPNPTIYIIDIAEEQITAVKKMVNKKYSGFNINIIQTDALDLKKYIKRTSVDWIETDFILAFFDSIRLKKLFEVWKHILAKDGYITFRDSVTLNGFDRILDRIKIFIGKIWLGISVYSHSLDELTGIFHRSGFQYKYSDIFMPYLKRFCIIKIKNHQNRN